MSMGNNIKNNTNSINNITWDAGISRTERWQNLGQKGVTLWFTGLSGSGKSTLAKALEQELLQQGLYCYRLDGDNIRHGLNNDLGFSDHERQENLRRVTEVAKLFTDSGAITLVSFISPFLRDRQKARQQHQDAQLPFYEVFVNTPINICENRDVKGLYAKARAGEIKQFTGIDSPYEAPINPDLIIETTNSSPQQSIQKIVTLLSQL